MTLVRANTGDRQFHLAVERQFLRNDLVGTTGDFTEKDFFTEIISCVFDATGYIHGRTEVFLLLIFCMPPPIALQCFFLLHGEIFLRYRLIVGKRRLFNGEELSIFTTFAHVIDDFGHKFLIFFEYC